jgi:hypothetical protein
MCVKDHSQICGRKESAQINGSRYFLDPPTDLPLTVGGGSKMEFYSGGPPIYTWHESIGPKSHRLLLSDIPHHLVTSLSTFP